MRPRIPAAESPAGAIVDRVVALTVVALAVAAVWLLASVQPDARGHGTHERLGMEPCSWPILYGRPCPTCGVTTAAAQLVHLHPLAALATQPFGAGLAAAGLFVAVVAALALVRRESFVARIALWPIGTITKVTIAVLLLGWGYTWITWPSGVS